MRLFVKITLPLLLCTKEFLIILTTLSPPLSLSLSHFHTHTTQHNTKESLPPSLLEFS